MNEPYVLEFGPFQLRFPQRTLSRNGEDIRLGSRAQEILIALVAKQGELISNRALVSRVWPDTVVDEGSLRVHLSAVRKALGEASDGTRYITNETGRGYRLAVPVTRRECESISQSTSPHADTPIRTMVERSTLPVVLARILGRGSIIQGLCELLPERRLMTIAGAGGIGKTTVAISLAHQFHLDNAGEITAHFVDFAPVTDPTRIASTVALRLGMPVSTHDPVPDLIAAIGQNRMLLVFDNCEHVIDAVAALAERLLHGTTGLRIVATSREPLRVEGEWVHRLAPLPVPHESMALRAEEGLSYASVALFVERARAVDSEFSFSDHHVWSVCEICRRLDGMPLAIEMAAARVASMDVQTLAARLGDRFALLTKGRRTALPRQQTLRAVLDWSYALLDARTQVVLQRMALFRSAFDVAGAVAVARCDEIDDLSVFDATADLVAKSLLTSERAGPATTYRLLETTRHYALDRLMESSDAHAARKRHATYCIELFEDPSQAWEGNARRASTVQHSHRLDDVRLAFDWAVSVDGDASLAVRLATVSSPLWFQLSLPYEFMRLVERAIASVPRAELEGTVAHAELLTAYGHAIWHTRGPVQDMANAFTASLHVARALGDTDFAMRSVWGLWSQKLQSGEYEASLALAREYEQLSMKSSQAAALETIRHTQALSYERLGDFTRARELIEAVIEGESRDPERAGLANAAQMDGGIAAWTLLMRLQWLQGQGAKANALARQAVDDAVCLGHDLSVCYCISMGALPVAIWSGDFAFAQTLLDVLRRHTKRNGLRFWDTWADGYEALLYERPFDANKATTYQREIFATMGCLASLRALTKDDRLSRPSWCQAELIRREAAGRSTRGTDVEAAFARAMDLARGQGANAWSRRAALSLARCRHVPAASDVLPERAAHSGHDGATPTRDVVRFSDGRISANEASNAVADPSNWIAKFNVA